MEEISLSWRVRDKQICAIKRIPMKVNAYLNKFLFFLHKLQSLFLMLQSVKRDSHPLSPYSMLVASFLAHSWPILPGIAFPHLAQH